MMRHFSTHLESANKSSFTLHWSWSRSDFYLPAYKKYHRKAKHGSLRNEIQHLFVDESDDAFVDLLATEKRNGGQSNGTEQVYIVIWD